jgi:hypothetical protein
MMMQQNYDFKPQSAAVEIFNLLFDLNFDVEMA